MKTPNESSTVPDLHPGIPGVAGHLSFAGIVPLSWVMLGRKLGETSSPMLMFAGMGPQMPKVPCMGASAAVPRDLTIGEHSHMNDQPPFSVLLSSALCASPFVNQSRTGHKHFQKSTYQKTLPHVSNQE
jgi:hypothetical protein